MEEEASADEIKREPEAPAVLNTGDGPAAFFTSALLVTKQNISPAIIQVKQATQTGWEKAQPVIQRAKQTVDPHLQVQL